jgi:serine/threonine-protein kinase
VPADLESVLLRCLEKEPADRFPTVAALRTALLACADAGRWTAREAAQWWTAHAQELAKPRAT